MQVDLPTTLEDSSSSSGIVGGGSMSYIDHSMTATMLSPSPVEAPLALLCGGTARNGFVPTDSCVAVERVSQRVFEVGSAPSLLQGTW